MVVRITSFWTKRCRRLAANHTELQVPGSKFFVLIVFWGKYASIHVKTFKEKKPKKKQPVKLSSLFV